MGKKSRFGSGMKSRNIFPRAWEQFFGLKILKFFDAGPDPGSGIFLTLDPRSGMEKLGSGIQDKHPGFAALVSCTVCYIYLCIEVKVVCLTMNLMVFFVNLFLQSAL